jgi:hypothetical protein
MTTRIPTMYGRYYVLTLVWRGKEYDITVFRNKLQKLQRPQAQKIAQSVYPSSRVIKYHESDPTDGPVILTTEAYKKISKKKKTQVNDDDSKVDSGNSTPSMGAFNSYGEETKCGKGEYFCNDEQKCKPIPKGHHVMPDGMLMKGETHKEQITSFNQLDKKKNCGCGQTPCITYGKQDLTKEGAAWTKKSGKNKEGGLNEKGRKSYERDNPGSDLKAPSKKKGNKRRASFCARMKGMKKKLTSKKTASDPDSRINKSLRAWNC